MKAYNLEHLNQDEIPSDWKSISGDHKRKLLDFYNVVSESIDVDDLKILSDLYNGVTGSIQFLNCDECGEELCIAEPISWDSFQGVDCSNESHCLNDCCLRQVLEEQ